MAGALAEAMATVVTGELPEESFGVPLYPPPTPPQPRQSGIRRVAKCCPPSRLAVLGKPGAAVAAWVGGDCLG